MLIGGLRPPNPLTLSRGAPGAPAPFASARRFAPRLTTVPLRFARSEASPLCRFASLARRPAPLCRFAALARRPHHSAASLRSLGGRTTLPLRCARSEAAPLCRFAALARRPHHSAASLRSLGGRTTLPLRCARSEAAPLCRFAALARRPHHSAASLRSLGGRHHSAASLRSLGGRTTLPLRCARSEAAPLLSLRPAPPHCAASLRSLAVRTTCRFAALAPQSPPLCRFAALARSPPTILPLAALPRNRRSDTQAGRATRVGASDAALQVPPAFGLREPLDRVAQHRARHGAVAVPQVGTKRGAVALPASRSIQPTAL